MKKLSFEGWHILYRWYIYFYFVFVSKVRYLFYIFYIYFTYIHIHIFLFCICIKSSLFILFETWKSLIIYYIWLTTWMHYLEGPIFGVFTGQGLYDNIIMIFRFSNLLNQETISFCFNQLRSWNSYKPVFVWWDLTNLNYTYYSLAVTAPGCMS